MVMGSGWWWSAKALAHTYTRHQNVLKFFLLLGDGDGFWGVVVSKSVGSRLIVLLFT